LILVCCEVPVPFFNTLLVRRNSTSAEIMLQIIDGRNRDIARSSHFAEDRTARIAGCRNFVGLQKPAIFEYRRKQRVSGEFRERGRLGRPDGASAALPALQAHARAGKTSQRTPA
jgi:hypothetical protein